MGPIDELFENFLIARQVEGHTFTEQDLAWAKYIYYCAACDMYNITMAVIKGDHSLKALAMVSEAMRVNINLYMESLPKQTVN